MACPSQRQSGEAIRRVKAALVKTGAVLKADNVFAVETQEGSRVLALPGDESTSRGLSVDGIVCADEAARLSPDMIAALRPMRARFAAVSRFLMLSTAWSRVDEFWRVWGSDDPTWIRIRSLADDNPRYSQAFLDSELAALGETASRREYLGEPLGHGASPFAWDLFDKATARHEPRVPPGPDFIPRTEVMTVVENPFRKLGERVDLIIDLPKPFSLDDPSTWRFRSQILVHDVGTTQDRSTAVVGGVGAFEPNPSLGVAHLEELPIGLRGTARATALAEVDKKYLSNSLIITDFSNDQSYSEQMSEMFGARVIGVSIGPAGDGNGFTRVPVPHGAMLKYSIGRTLLFDKLLTVMETGGLRLPLADPIAKQAFRQLADLEVQVTNSGNRIYACQPSKHDDLAISLALLVWAARHAHNTEWMKLARPGPSRNRPRPLFSSTAWT